MLSATIKQSSVLYSVKNVAVDLSCCHTFLRTFWINYYIKENFTVTLHFV